MNRISTRFAPSPTGYMHIGNLRTALYAYLFAKSQGGDFILRIEDTDRARYVSDAVEFIERTLAAAKIIPDEGPHHGGRTAQPSALSEVHDNSRGHCKHIDVRSVRNGDVFHGRSRKCCRQDDNSRVGTDCRRGQRHYDDSAHSRFGQERLVRADCVRPDYRSNFFCRAVLHTGTSRLERIRRRPFD